MWCLKLNQMAYYDQTYFIDKVDFYVQSEIAVSNLCIQLEDKLGDNIFANLLRRPEQWKMRTEQICYSTL